MKKKKINLKKFITIYMGIIMYGILIIGNIGNIFFIFFLLDSEVGWQIGWNFLIGFFYYTGGLIMVFFLHSFPSVKEIVPNLNVAMFGMMLWGLAFIGNSLSILCRKLIQREFLIILLIMILIFGGYLILTAFLREVAALRTLRKKEKEQ
jgi:hypothetical protein